MDKEIRNLIFNTTQSIRRLLDEEFALQLEGTFDVHPDGRIDEQPGPQLSAAEKLVRERIVQAIQHRRAAGESAIESVRGYRSEAVFTFLNRLAALKMMEARGLVLPCVSQGEQSQGFKEFSGLAPGLIELPDKGYRLYLECIFDEIGREVGVLFDRTDAASQLWPRRKALEAALEKLNNSELAGVWAEDETIGWIYQYYNDPEERRKMREESAAPRNSRELAVRNQFFTPRYVVEFLTENTLGRIWYEMCRGNTSLTEKCRYMVRRPNEVFLNQGEVSELPLPFEQSLPSIIGDPREAYFKVFLQAETDAYVPPTGWVKEAFGGRFLELPADPDDPHTRWVGAAIPPAQIEAIIGEKWQPMEEGTKLHRMGQSILDGKPEPETRCLPIAWAILSGFARSNQFARGYERPAWEKLWSFFRHLAQTLEKFGAKENQKPSQEELLKQPVFIQHRPIKDPRTILMLDPACGSMHFGLYAFDLFEVIYQEAWEIEEKQGADGLLRPVGMQSLHATYSGKDSFLKDVPRLILEHNIHGIDIDPRAAQIAGLALWMRAQKAWQRMGLKPVERPPIRRSNIVCAEPMPGEKDLLRDFVGKHFSSAERPLFQRLLDSVWDAMQLAGEAGSLLKIEEEIRTLLLNAKALWKEGSKLEQASLFPDVADSPHQKELRLDLSGITDEQFWEHVEDRIYKALRDYTEQAAKVGGFQRRLFAEDAARGFAFIDLCRKRYDVALMNPPFGDASRPLETYCEKAYPSWASNLAAAFISRCRQTGSTNGKVGWICDHSIAVRSAYETFRRTHFLSRQQLKLWVKLGWEVLDASVETFCAVLQHDETDSDIIGIDLDSVSEKKAKLLETISVFSVGTYGLSILRHSTLNRLPNCVIDVTWPSFLIGIFEEFDSLKSQGLEALAGHQLEADRHYRLFWELDFRSDPLGSGLWTMAFKGGDYSPGYLPEFFVAMTGKDYSKVPESSANVLRNSAYQHSAGVGYGKRGVFIDAQPLRPSSIFTHEGFGFPLESEHDRWLVLTFLNSDLFSFGINKYCGQHKQSGYVNLFAFPPKIRWNAEIVRRKCSQFVKIKTTWTVIEEFDYLFICPALVALKNFNEQSLRNAAEVIHRAELAAVEDLNQLSNDLNSEVYAAFTVSEADIKVCADFCRERPLLTITEPGHLVVKTFKESVLVDQLLSWVVGLCLGRWDIRYATGEKLAPVLPDPFAPLPMCPPGQLQNAQSLPAGPEDVPAEYPIRVPWDGILLDDPNHPLDIEGRVREVIEIIWKDRAEAIEHEACEILGVKSLRDYFRKPAGFFADHLKRYSKSRRQAPIYWPLSSPNNLYTVWLYYHRLTPDTLFTVLRDHLKPKLEYEEGRAFQLRQEAGATPSPSQRGDIVEADDLVQDLRAFRAELERVAPLFRPNLNDGVIINYAPLWRMIGLPKWRKDCQAVWDELVNEKYDWAHLAMHLWPERVIPKCATDRSLAIAHGLEETFWEFTGAMVQQQGEELGSRVHVQGAEDERQANGENEDPGSGRKGKRAVARGKWISKKVSEAEVQKLIAARTSPAVKAALESLTGAGVQQPQGSASGGKGRRKRK